MKIFFIAGEASGDAIGANLIRELQALSAEPVECVGVGGDLMEEAGLEKLLPMEELATMGILEVLPKFPHLFRIYKGILGEIEKRQPDAVVTIDFPDFNFFVQRALKTRGKSKAKRIHCVAPTVWAWRPGRAKMIAGFLDGLTCLFPFEPPYFKKHGLEAIFTGHPMVEEDISHTDPAKFREANQIPLDATILGLFFGSREHEFKNLSETLKKSAVLLKEKIPNLQVVVPTLPKLEFDVLKLLEDFDCPAYVVANADKKWDAFKCCDIALAASGTVGLELAYAGVPHVIAYKINPVSAAIVKSLANIQHAHLANNILKREVVPEFLQGNCDPVKIADALYELVSTPEKMAFQKKGFEKLRELLGGNAEHTPSSRMAEHILKQCNKPYERSLIGTNGRLAGPV